MTAFNSDEYCTEQYLFLPTGVRIIKVDVLNKDEPHALCVHLDTPVRFEAMGGGMFLHSAATSGATTAG